MSKAIICNTNIKLISKYLTLKNRIFFVLIFFLPLLISINSNAQEGFSVGLKGGIGYSRYYFLGNKKYYIDQNYVQVIQKGLVINYRDDKNFGMQLQIMQTQKAFEENISKTYKQRVMLDCIEFPILSSYKFGKKKSGLVLTAGLHFSKAFGATISSTGQSMPGDTSIIRYENLAYNKVDYGLQGGLGYQFTFWRNILHIEAMYSQGLNNIFDRDYTATYRSLNQSLFINLIYKICLSNNKKAKVTLKN
jgi:hypothetical protein